MIARTTICKVFGKSSFVKINCSKSPEKLAIIVSASGVISRTLKSIKALHTSKGFLMSTLHGALATNLSFYADYGLVSIMTVFDSSGSTETLVDTS